MKRLAGTWKTMPIVHEGIKLTIISALSLGLMLSLAGCNTMQGLGKDVEKAGEAIQKSTK